MTPARTCTRALAAWLTILACLQLCFTHADVYDKTKWCDGQPYSCATLDAARVKMREMASLLKWDNIDEDAQLTEYVWQSPEMTDLLLESAKRSVRRRRKRKLQRFDRFITKWDRLIPFTFDDNVPSTGRDVVRAAVRHLELHTCIRFEERNYTNALARSNHQSHIKFQSGTRCASYIGKIRPMMQPIELGSKCLARGIGVAVHEIGHTLGLWHEHQRSDRDRHVTIHQENLIPSFSSYASFIVIGDTNNVLPYDYGSIMHYNAHANSLNGNITVDPLDKLYLNTIGQEHGLSFLDAKTLNLAYCADVCHSEPDLPTCHNRGYPDPNDCRRCRCPDGFSGRHCDQLAPPVNAACGGAVSLGETGWEEVSSPHYDDRLTYDDQTSCTWLVEAPIGHHVVISFDGPRFGLLCATGRSTLCWHFVELRYRADLSETGPRFCCHTKPELTLRSDGQKVMILFRSNYTFASNRTHGFKIRLHAERDSDREPGLVDPDLKSVTPPTAATTAENGKGGAVIDVAFLLDSSGGVGASNWRRYVLDFAQRVARSFVVGATRAQFGAVAFGSRAVLAVPLVTSRSGDVLERALAGVAWQRGFSNATGGLRVVADDFFSVWRGGRRGVPQLVVLVTDGPLQARYDADRTAAVDALRRRGVGVLVVLVGDAVTRRQAADMTSRQPRVIKVTQFDRLESVVPDVVAQIRATAERDSDREPGLVDPDLKSVTPPTAATTPENGKGGAVIDVAFLLDSSGGVGASNWRRYVLGFAQRVARSFVVGATRAQFGAVAFGSRAVLAVPLVTSRSGDVLERALAGVAWQRGFSNATGGLRVVADDFFSVWRGGRRGVPQLVVLVTDGPLQARYDADRTAAVDALRRRGVGVLVVLVGDAVTRRQAADMTSRQPRVIKVTQFDRLESVVPDVVAQIRATADVIILEEVTPTTKLPPGATTSTVPPDTTPEPRETTRELLDLTFVLDSSESVGDDGWRLVKSFVKGVVGHFRIGADDVRVGVVTFSLEARVALPLGGAGGDRDAVYRRVDAAEWMDNWSNTAGGLRAMRQQLYSGAQDRKEAPNVCVLLTDGPSNWNASLTVPEAARARAAGIRLLVVAVTPHVDTEEVHGVASRPRPDNEFFVDRFDELQSRVEAVSDRLHILAAHVQVPKVTSSTTTATLSTTTTTLTTTTTTPSTTTTAPSTTTTTPTTTTTTPSTTTTTPTTTTTTSSTSTTTPTTTTNTPSATTTTPLTTTTTPTPATTTPSTTTTTPTTTTTTTTSSTTTTAPTTTTTTPSTTKTTPLTIPTTTASSTTTTSQTTTTTPSTTTTTPSTTTTTPSTTTFSHTTTPAIGLHGNGTPIPDAAADAWRCDFETEAGRGVWCGMTQSRSDQFDWTLQRGKTRSQFTGPLGAFGGSHYIYIEASSPRVPGDTATVYVSPRRTGNHCLRFHVSAYGFHVGRLDVFVTSRDDDVIFRLTGDQGPGWRAKAVSLELRSDTDRIAFRGVRGGEYSGDIALDSIRLGAGEC